MEKIVVDLEVNTGKGVKDIKKLNNELDNTKDVAKEASTKVSGLEKAGKKGSKGLGFLSKGLKGIGTAMKAAGIGLLLTILASLFEVMRKNQKVLDAIETATNFIAVGFKAVTDAVSDAYKSVSESTGGFDALGKVMKGLLTIAIAPLKLGFYDLKLAMQVLKLGYESMFGDDKSIEAAKKGVEETKLAILGVVSTAVKAGKDVVANVAEAITEVSTGVSAVVTELGKIDPKELVNTASDMTKLGNSAEVAAAKQAGLVEEFDRLAEKQRQLRDDTSLSIEDRKKANEELGKILEDQEKAMIKQADAQLASARAQYAINGNQENYIALIDAETNRKGVLAAIEGKRSEQKVNEVALLKEEIDLTNSAGEADSALNIQKQKFAAEQISNEQLRLEALISINEQEKIIEEERLQAIVDLANAGTQAKIDAQIALDEFTNTNNEENASLRYELAEKEIQLEERIAQKKMDINLQYVSFAQSLGGLMSQLAGKNKALATAGLILEKGAAIASVVVGATKSIALAKANEAKIPFFTQLGTLTVPNFAKAASMAGTLKSITSTKIGAGLAIAGIGASAIGGGGSVPSAGATPTAPAPSSAPAPTPSRPPAFNVVGASGTNQLASAIGGQSQQPTRTYVVAGDVSTAQELDRNIVTGAAT